MKLDRKLLLFELNEVPYRILDKYCADRPTSALRSMLQKSVQYRTHTPDQLALDPWISWPTLHRGVHDEAREDIATSDVAPSILKFFGMRAPCYMRGRAAVRLEG